MTLALLLTLGLTTIWSQNAPLVAGKGEQKVVSTGMGATSEQATQDALRSAIEIAVGSMVSSNTLVSNDKIIRDEIFNHSKGFVRSYEVVSESGDPTDGYVVTISAIVTREHIANTLKAQGVSVNYNAKAMFVQLKEWDNLANAERTMAKNLFGLEAIKRNKTSVYDYSFTVDEPIRSNNEYKVKVHWKAIFNDNWESEYQKMLTTLDQLCYEKTILTYNSTQREVKYVSTFYGGALYTQRIQDGVDELGNPVWIEREVAVERSYFRNPFEEITNSNPYDDPYNPGGGGGSISFLAADLMDDQSQRVREQHQKFSRQLTSQDLSRLNGFYGRQRIVYDLFMLTYTPYYYVVIEDADNDWKKHSSPERIIIYKFLHPDTAVFVHYYATWRFGEFAKNITFDYDGRKQVKKNVIYKNCSGRYSQSIETSLDNDNSYAHGHSFFKPNYVWTSVITTYTLSEEEFSNLTRITVSPTHHTNFVEYYLKKESLE